MLPSPGPVQPAVEASPPSLSIKNDLKRLKDQVECNRTNLEKMVNDMVDRRVEEIISQFFYQISNPQEFVKFLSLNKKKQATLKFFLLGLVEELLLKSNQSKREILVFRIHPYFSKKRFMIVSLTLQDK